MYFETVECYQQSKMENLSFLHSFLFASCPASSVLLLLLPFVFFIFRGNADGVSTSGSQTERKREGNSVVYCATLCIVVKDAVH